MNEFLRKFDTIRFVAPWSIFGNFSFFWIQVWILNLGRFGIGPNQNRAGPVWPVTGQTRPVPTGLVNPGWVPGKSKNCTWCNQGTASRFQESRMAKQCLDAGKSTGSRQGNTHTTNGTFYRHGSTVQTSRFSITMLALNCCLRNSETELQLRQQIQPWIAASLIRSIQMKTGSTFCPLR